MDLSRWSRIEQLYEQVLAQPAADREAFVDTVCDGDTTLVDELRSMLATEDGGQVLSIERMVMDTEAPELTDPLLGAAIGPWRVESVLGRGGAGTVYLVERNDGQYEQRAALKLIAPGVITPDLIGRFRTERRILARLVHANIARLIDGGFTAEGTPYLVMELVDGAALTSYCDGRGSDIDERLRLFRIVCAAVQHAHRALVVHRDLKPSNIYVSNDGEVKLLDFGIAKLLDPEAFGLDAPATRTEQRALTPAYAAPEQLRGEAVTTAADVYALGVVLYELLAGRRPYEVEGLSPAEIERLVTGSDPPAPSAAAAAAAPAVSALRSTAPRRLVKRLRGDLDRICLMAIRKEPERRYESVEQLSEDIERFLAGRPVVAEPDTLKYRVRRFAGRHRIAVAAGAAFVALLSAFAVVATMQARQILSERDRVRVERDKAQEIVRVLVDLFEAANPQITPGGDRQSIRQFLEGAEVRMLAALESRDDVRATMKHVLGQMHSARSDYQRARTLLEEALADSRRLHGADAIETLRVQMDVGRLLGLAGEQLAARAMFADALERAERVVGERHALTAEAVHVLATTYVDRPEEARRLFTRALSIRREVLPPGDLEIARTLAALAAEAMNGERHAEARARFDEALKVAEAVNGGRNTTAHMVMNDLASLLIRTGDYAGAEALLRRALALGTEIIGPRSMPVANDVNNLATALANQGRLAEASELFRESYDRNLELMGAEHWRTANSARNAGLILLWMDRPAEARPWLERAVSATEAFEGRNTRGALYVRSQLASVELALGHRREAIAALETAVTGLETLAPPEGHYTLADARVELGRALLADGQAADAERQFRLVQAFRDRVQPDGHPQRLTAACDLAQALSALGRDAEALALLERCVPALMASGFANRPSPQAARRLLERLQAASAAKH